MVAFVVKNMGGEIPKDDPRLLPDNQAGEAWNVDLVSGPLDGLPAPEFVFSLASTPGPVARAYRVPGPTPSDADVWLALPSPYSSVVRSPLANDTLHRIYWTNPPDSPFPGAHWNTYARIRDGLAFYDLGFTAPDPAAKPSVAVSGGTIPRTTANSVTLVTPGLGYAPGTALRLNGGTPTADSRPTELLITSTQAVSVALVNGGSGGTDGAVTITGTTGTGIMFQATGTITGGVLQSGLTITEPGDYSANLSNVLSEPVTGGGLTGAVVSVITGVFKTGSPVFGSYSTTPANPVTSGNIGGTGVGATFTVGYVDSGVPEVERSYLWTYVDEYGLESSPCLPSDVLAGPSDGTWVISALPVAPPTPSGKIYPVVTGFILYRTVSGQSTGAQFYRVHQFDFITDPAPSGIYTDATKDTDIVQGLALVSAAWAPPPDDLDGLTAMPGGFLVGFTANTIHFCEPDRPHAWPAAYDLSVQYEIVGFGVWQQTLMVLTKGYPSSGSGSTPANFTLSQVQVAEPCVARGSIVTDLLGVYYASQNGLVMLSYYGMMNQTLTLVTKNDWLTEFRAASIIACRHRAQYLALNDVGLGFIIDYTEARLGVVRLNTFSNASCVWNDVYSGDAYICANKAVYRWDSPSTPAMVWRWRSKRFSLPAPANLGACQITVSPDVLTASAAAPVLDNGDPRLQLPAGANCVFRMFVDDEQKVFEAVIAAERSMLRLPSGFLAFDWQFEIVSRVPVFRIELASTMKELRSV